MIRKLKLQNFRFENFIPMSKTAYKVGDILDDKTLAIGIVKADNDEVTMLNHWADNIIIKFKELN